MRKGFILVNLGRFKEALEAYDKVLQAEPGNLKLLSEKAMILKELKRDAEVLKIYESCLKMTQRT